MPTLSPEPLAIAEHSYDILEDNSFGLFSSNQVESFKRAARKILLLDIKGDIFREYLKHSSLQKLHKSSKNTNINHHEGTIT